MLYRLTPSVLFYTLLTLQAFADHPLDHIPVVLCQLLSAHLGSATHIDYEIYKQEIGDIVIGSVLGDSSQRAIQVRIAGLLAGIPENVPVHTVNR